MLSGDPTSTASGAGIDPSHRTALRRTVRVLLILGLGVAFVAAAPAMRAPLGPVGHLTLHTVLETTSIVVAMTAFAVGSAGRRRGMPGNVLGLAWAFFFVAILDFSHMLSFEGMPDFVTANTVDKTIRFWLAARTVASAALLYVAVAPWRPTMHPALRRLALGAGVAVVGVAHWLILAHPELLPRTFVPGHGLTTAKVVYEYGLIALDLAAAVALAVRMRGPLPFNAPALFGAVCAMAMSELMFTLYRDAADVSIVVGHLYKVASYFFLYRAVFVDVVEFPYELLRASEAKLLATLAAMPATVLEVDRDGRVVGHPTARDPSLAAVVGEVVGKTFGEFLPAAVARVCMSTIAEADANPDGVPARRQVRATVGGRSRWFELSVSVRASADAASRRFVLLAVDITTLKADQANAVLQARRAEALLGLPAAAVGVAEEPFLERAMAVARELTGSSAGFVRVAREGESGIDAGTGPASDPGTLAVPVVEGDAVRVVLSVAKKPEPYTDLDVETLRLLADTVWRVLGQRRAESALRASESRLSAVLDGVDAAIFMKDRTYKYRYVNQEMADLMGRPPSEVIGADDQIIIGGDRADAYAASDRRVVEDGERWASEEPYADPVTGALRTFWSVKVPLRGADGAIEGICGVSTEITARKELERSVGMLSLAVEQSPNAVIITDVNARIEYANPAFCRVTGYSLAEVLGRNPRVLQSGKTPRERYVEMWARLSEGLPWRGELVNRRKDGTEFVESTLISPVRQADGAITHYLSIKDNITEKKAAEERIERLAHFDQLTGLPNRVMLLERFRMAASLARRRNEQLAVLFLDLDRFKDINDTLGHSLGDDLLIEVSRRLRATVRDHDTVSRLGGDEFILVLPGIDASGVTQVAERLLEAVARPILLPSHELTVSASIGIAMYPQDGEDFETLSKNADAAMYRVKQDARNGYRFFTPEMQRRSARTLTLASALRHAMERDQLSLHYQPQISLSDGRVAGVEALLRWRHPEFGMVSPGEFIPIAEETGQIIAIGEWVLRTAATQLRGWLAAGAAPMVVAVNLSAGQFRHGNLTQLIAGVLADVGLPPHCLELELTEGVAMDDAVAATTIMDRLHEQGVRMSIDDFGTGFSSLNYLKRFKAYMLKIDQSFVRGLPGDANDRAIVQAIIQIAGSLGMMTIAEGVETAEQLAYLQSVGCHFVQGYHLSRPLPPEALETFLRERGVMPVAAEA